MSKGGNLGKASLVLTTKDDTGKGLKKAEGGVKGWASGLKGKVGGALAAVGGLLASFTAPGLLMKGVDSLADAGKQAAALGVASDQFMALSGAARSAGVDMQAFGEILQEGTLRVAEGSAETQAALGQIGLTLDSLKGKSADQVFYAVADGLAGVSDQGTRASVTARLFGDEGMKLVGVLSQGSGSLKEFVDRQKAMGTAISQKDMDGVLSAQARMAAFGQRMEGTLNRLTLAGLPLLELGFDIADGILSWLPAFEDVKYVGLAVFQAVGMAGAYTWDTLKAGAGGFSVSLGIVAAAWGDMMQAVGIDAGKGLKDAGKGMVQWGGQQIDSFGQSAKGVENWFMNMGGAKKAGAELGKKAGEQMAKTFAFEYRANPAIEKGSAEDFSARIRWQQQNETLQQQQVKRAEETAKNTAATVTAVNKLADKIGTTKPMRTV